MASRYGPLELLGLVFALLGGSTLIAVVLVGCFWLCVRGASQQTQGYANNQPVGYQLPPGASPQGYPPQMQQDRQLVQQQFQQHPQPVQQQFHQNPQPVQSQYQPHQSFSQFLESQEHIPSRAPVATVKR